MLQERIEGKWLASFRRVMALNGIGKGTTAALIYETQSRPVLAHLAELALYDLGADFCMIKMPSPPQTAPVPVKGTGTSLAIQHNRAAIEAMKQCEIVVDCTVEGMIHSPEWPEIDSAGARILVITNEHPEILERTEPFAELGPKVDLGVQMISDAKEMRVTSKAGTDLIVDLTDAPCGGTAGFGTTPGHVAHWPGGAAWDDPKAYGFSHVGWGMNPRARWVSGALYDKRDMQAVEFRAWAGNFLWSTGANQYADRFTEGHFDLPMRNCTITLDKKIVVKEGVLQGDLVL